MKRNRRPFHGVGPANSGFSEAQLPRFAKQPLLILLTLDSTPECILILMPSIQNGLQATFQIGELAKRTALSIDAIRFYERRKLLPPASRSAGRFRLYIPDAIGRLRFVRQMQGLGFSLQEIKELMGVRADRAHACSTVRRFLKTKLADIIVRIRELQQLETELKADLRKCNRALKQQRRKTCGCPVLESAEQ
jgi:MerR family mercuric resistance operon transcriptional regulator